MLCNVTKAHVSVQPVKREGLRAQPRPGPAHMLTLTLFLPAEPSAQAVNIVKVLQALDQIRELLKASAAPVLPGRGLQHTVSAASASRGSTSVPLLHAAVQDSSAASDTFFADLGVYLTLERAQRLYGFQADRYGLDDAAAAEIAAVFARVSPQARGWAAAPSSALWCSWQGPRRPRLSSAAAREATPCMPPHPKPLPGCRMAPPAQVPTSNSPRRNVYPSITTQYDTNDDGFISPEEFRRLCAENQVGAAAGSACSA